MSAASDAYETVLEIHWNFDYEIGIEKLRNLYAKSKKRPLLQFMWVSGGADPA